MDIDIVKNKGNNIYLLVSQLWNNLPPAEKIRIIAIILLSISILYFLIYDQNFVMGSGIGIEANNYLDGAQKSSAAAFLVARSLNAVISVLQTINGEVSLVVISGSVSLGEFLDPINDMIERFSWAMLAVTVAIGIQKFLMDIGTSINLNLLIIPMLLLILLRIISQLYTSIYLERSSLSKLNKVMLFISHDKSHNYFITNPSKIIAVVFFIHFSIPLVYYVNNQLSNNYIEDQINTTINVIERSKDKLNVNVSDIKDIVKYKNELINLFTSESEIIMINTIKLISLFFVKIMILPILLILILIKIEMMIIFPKNRNEIARSTYNNLWEKYNNLAENYRKDVSKLNHIIKHERRKRA